MSTDRPDIAERYISAGQSSNLKCETREDAPHGDTAVLIAAGWSQSRLGGLLMRLQSRPYREGLAQAHHQIALQAAGWGIERPQAVAVAVLSWWLDHVCGRCKGVKFERVPGTPSLSAYKCRSCHGAGERPLSYGDEAKRLTDWMDGCRESGAQSIRNKLRR